MTCWGPSGLVKIYFSLWCNTTPRNIGPSGSRNSKWQVSHFLILLSIGCNMKGLLLCHGCLPNRRAGSLPDNCACCGTVAFVNDCGICKLLGTICKELDSGTWGKTWRTCKPWFSGRVVVAEGTFVNVLNNPRTMSLQCDFWCKRSSFSFTFKTCIITQIEWRHKSLLEAKEQLQDTVSGISTRRCFP